LHGRNTRSEARAGTSGEHDRRGDRCQLPHRCDADEVGDVDTGAEPRQLHGADEGKNGPDQKVDNGDNRERTAARLRERFEHLCRTNLRPCHRKPRQKADNLAQHRDKCAQRAQVLSDARAETGNPARRRFWAGAPRWQDRGERQ
jgi:hypothetical protein